MNSQIVWLSVLSVVPLFAILLGGYVSTRRKRPVFRNSDIVYQERYASGSSYRNFLTRIGGARGCLRIVATHEILWITSWFPFSLLSWMYDLEHVIPIRSITAVDRVYTFGLENIRVTFLDSSGQRRAVRLRPRNLAALEAAIRSSGQQDVRDRPIRSAG